MNQGSFKTGGFTDGDMPAFATTEANFHNENWRSSGMSLRQYAAIHAPVSMIDANESLRQSATFGRPSDRDAFPIRQVIAENVRMSVMYADMLLAELAKTQGTAEVAQSLSDKGGVDGD